MPRRLASPIAVPLYRQVREILTGRIARGDWAPGERLPSEPRLAEELGVSPGTVRKALDEMTAERLLIRRQGAGTYVATATADGSLFRFFRLINADGDRVMPSSREVQRDWGAATEEEARRLGLAAGDAVFRLRRVRLSATVPIMLESVTVSPKHLPGLTGWDGEFPNTLYDFYQETFGITVLRVDEVLRAVPADPDQARLFQLKAGAPLLEIQRVAYSFEERAIEIRASVLDTTSFAYSSELR